ncbi:MAG: ABC transporter permease [Coriobacteriia bacterium]|nr:ABC transporter permease [Coriobacteriia bacterium]
MLRQKPRISLTPRSKGSTRLNTRTRLVIAVSVAATYLLGVFIWGWFLDPSSYAVHFESQFIPPSWGHIFGTDFMGRDMFFRSLKGLSNSMLIGLLASLISSAIALAFGTASALFGGKVDKLVLLAVDCCMGLPHLVLVILISVALGGGATGVMLGVALTHWPELTRIVRAEVLQLREAWYVKASYKMGKSRLYVAAKHIVPHVIPVYIVGLVLLFPHAIMHEAAVTFLGFGLPAETPAIGVILSEAMRHIATGKWWLALFPGLLLIVAVLLFDTIGENLKRLLNPASAHE